MPSWEQEVPGHILLGAAAPVTRCPHSRRRQPNQRHCPTGGIGCLREPPLPPGLGALTWVTNPLPPAEHTPLPCLEPRPGSRSKQRAGPCCPLDPQPGRLRQEGCRGGYGPSARRAAPPASACPPPPNAGREGDDLSPPGWTLRVRRGPGARAGLGSSHPTTCGPWSLALAGPSLQGLDEVFVALGPAPVDGKGCPTSCWGRPDRGQLLPRYSAGGSWKQGRGWRGPGRWGACDRGGQAGLQPPNLCPQHAHPTQGHSEPGQGPPGPAPRRGSLGLRPEEAPAASLALGTRRPQLWPPWPLAWAAVWPFTTDLAVTPGTRVSQRPLRQHGRSSEEVASAGTCGPKAAVLRCPAQQRGRRGRGGS